MSRLIKYLSAALLAGLLTVSTTGAPMQAFEAHMVNVTAQINNQSTDCRVLWREWLAAWRAYWASAQTEETPHSLVAEVRHIFWQVEQILAGPEWGVGTLTQLENLARLLNQGQENNSPSWPHCLLVPSDEPLPEGPPAEPPHPESPPEEPSSEELLPAELPSEELSQDTQDKVEEIEVSQTLGSDTSQVIDNQ